MRAFLRADIELSGDGAGAGGSLVIDRAVGRSFRFAPAETLVLRALAEEARDAPALARLLRTRGFDLPEAAVARFLDELRALALLGRPAARRLRRIRRARELFFRPSPALLAGQLRAARIEPAAAARLDVGALPGTEFACQATGACCHRFLLGPLTSGDREKIDAYRWPEGARLPAGADAVEAAGGAWFLRRREGRCVFLGSDGLCEVHRRLGADRKPIVCRLFPFRPVLAGGTLRVSLSSECSGFEGHGRFPAPPAPAAAHAPALRALVAETGEALAVPDRVLVAGREVSRDDLERADAAAIAVLLGEESGDLGARLEAALGAYGPGGETSLSPHATLGLRHTRTQTASRDRAFRALLLDLHVTAREGARAPGLLEATRLAYRRLGGLVEREAWRAPVRLEAGAADALARSAAGSIFGKQHLRAPDALVGAATLAIFAALAAREAAGIGRSRGLEAARRDEALVALRDLAPAFESAGGLRAVLAVRLLESGFAAAGALAAQVAR